MSVYNNLDVEGIFTGITTQKGDILVNNGSSNSAFPVSVDGYVLSADSTQPFGLKWISSSGGGGVPMNDINIVPFDFATNDTMPVVIPNTSHTNVSGNILFMGTINCKLSKARRYFTTGLYKNNALIPNTQKKYGGIDDVAIPVSVHQTVALVGSDIFDIRINVDNADCQVTIDGVNPYNNSYLINSTTILAINNTNPHAIQDLTFTGVSGTIALIANLNCVISHAHSYFTIGIYKNNVLIPTSKNKYGGINNFVIPVPINIMIDLIPSDVITFCINTNSNTDTVIVYERTMVYSTYSNSVTLVPQIYSSTLFSTDSTIPIAIGDLTLTGIFGKYLIIGELNCHTSISRNNFYVGLYLNGNLISFTNKTYGGVDNIITAIPLIADVMLHITDIFEVKIWSQSFNCTVVVNERSLLYLPN